LRRTSSIVCCTLAAISLVVLFHTDSIAYFLYSWKLCREDPLLRVTPGPLPTLGTSTVKPPSPTYFGVSFKTPWEKVFNVKQWKTFARVQFEDGQFVALYDPTTAPNRINISKAAALTKGRDITEVYGRDAMHSNYDFLHAVLYVTPDQLSLMSGWNRFIRNMVFINLKHWELVGDRTSLYYFQVNELRGFQKGDPQKSDLVIIDAFDDGDRECQLWIGKTKRTHGAVSQEDINAILSSIHIEKHAMPSGIGTQPVRLPNESGTGIRVRGI